MTDVSGRAVALRDRLRHRATAPGARDLRPLWRGQAFEAHAQEPITIRRAWALAAVLDAVDVPIRDEECIVGTPAGALGPLPCTVDEAAFARYKAVNEAVGERTFVSNFDHVAVDYAGLLRVGLPGLLSETRSSWERHTQPERKVFLEAVGITLQAAIRFSRRWADACRRSAEGAEPERQRELLGMATDLEAIAGGVPTTFAQAVQLVWLVHVIFCLEGRGAMAFGRMDQYLYPFYRDEQEARPILECLWAKLEEPLIPNPIQNIAIGGQTPLGEDATNPLSYLMLEVTRTVSTPCSNLSARLHRGTPVPFYDACCRTIATGIGFPAVFNDDVLIPALTDLGIPLEDARDYAFVGCIETFLPGKMPPWSDSRVNLLAALDRILHNGRDGLTGAMLGVETGAPESLANFDAFMHAYAVQVKHLVEQHCAQICARKRAVDAQQFASPFLSAFVADCIARGLDINAGGARHAEFHGPAGMGLGSTADALAAVKWFVYDRRALTWEELLTALRADFRDQNGASNGYEALGLRLLNQAPKYGNGDPYVDQLAADVVRLFTSEVLAQRTPAGGHFVPLMAANISNITAGKEVGATPDGRRATEPMSDAASPTFGRDRRGPTAVIESLSAVDYRPVVGGTVVNVKFSPKTLAGEEGTSILRALIQTYFRQGGMQMQFNVTGRQTLEAARREPERYRDLVVRVSGFSALYVNLSDEVQRDILARTEH